MVVQIHSAAVMGIDAHPISIEVVVTNGMPHFSIVGLAGSSVKEAKERVYSAIKSSEFLYPQTRKIVNLAPANMPKGGTRFDLGIAIGLLLAGGVIEDGEVQREWFDSTLVLGELSLDGTVKSVPGVLQSVLMAKERGLAKALVPVANVKEASLVSGIEVYGVENLKEAMDFKSLEVFTGRFLDDCPFKDKGECSDLKFEDIKGQLIAKRALEIAAAGGHNVMLKGPPGSGKTMLAKALPSILPPLSFEEAIEVIQIASVSGDLNVEEPLFVKRPFRSVHHGASFSALVGGGSKAVPGEITRAHKGVLFLDEIAEFPRPLLESLRQPLEDKEISLARLGYRYRYPADFILLSAHNPCPCGFKTHPKKVCVCTQSDIHRYQKKLSGPLLDRIDLFVEVKPLASGELLDIGMRKGSSDEWACEYSSKRMRANVVVARQMQARRFNSTTMTNAQMNSNQVRMYCEIDASLKSLLESAVEKYDLSARAFFRILKLARTIADLDSSLQIKESHLCEALSYRDR